MIIGHIVILSLAILLVVLAMFVGFAPISWWVRSKDRKEEMFEPDVTHWKLGDEIWLFDGYKPYPMFGYKLVAFDEKGCVLERNERLFEFDFLTNKKYRFKNESMCERLNPDSTTNKNKRISLNISKYKNHLQ